jgi:spore germination protein
MIILPFTNRENSNSNPTDSINIARSFTKTREATKRNRYLVGIILDIICILLIAVLSAKPTQQFLLSPLASTFGNHLTPLTAKKGTAEVFGFAPYWTFNKLQNVNFDVLTTFSYFGLDVDGMGNVEQSGSGYDTFQSDEATQIFQKAHDHNTRVVLTLTQMEPGEILALMDNPQAQENAINQAVTMVKERGIDGINVDLEYGSDPGQDYRNKFSRFITNLTNRMHKEIPQSQVTVSVYASAIKDPKIYDIKALGQVADGIFMMAYDFAVAGSDNAIPTSPLHGHKEGKYWYDVSSAVEDFLTQMPANKLILGVPYYGYNYVVNQPSVKAETLPYYSWKGQPTTQTYAIAAKEINKKMDGIDDYKEGWDNEGKVGYKAYHIAATNAWRIVFEEDPKSLGIKYDYAITKQLAGVGMWALGFDEGRTELWTLLENKFGTKKFADNRVTSDIKLVNN